MKTQTTVQLAQILWDYHCLKQYPIKADCILGLGSEDIRVAHYCAQLYNKGFAPLIVFSGNRGNFTKDIFLEPEAHIFKKQALAQGVPASKIIVEDKATNTGENILLTKKLLQQLNIPVSTILMVSKPNTQRRIYATAPKIWPKINTIVLAPPITFAEKPTKNHSQTALINEMVGDLQRIKIYPEMGYQISQDIPPHVWQAYLELIKRGYTHHLLPIL
jgi:uncharacterized SAM-binding protein YcdF (DUF218 family)